jgi:Protein of unknown function (DUF2752)
VFLGVSGLATAVLVARPPAPGAYPPCLWRSVTGFDCPFCGGLRATSALVHGHFAAAADYNLLVTVGVPLAALLGLAAVLLGPRSRPVFDVLFSRSGLLVLASLGLGFMVLRMIPFAGWLTSTG